MKKFIPYFVLCISTAVFAQDVGMYNRGLAAFNAGNLDAAAQTFYELSENSTDQELRSKAEYYLAQSLFQKGLPVSAMVYYAAILRAGPTHPYYLKAVAGLLKVQTQLDDQYLIPSTLNNQYNEAWATLPAEDLAHINYLIGAISHRKAKFEDARAFLEAVPKTSRVYSKARYMLGVVLSDLRYPGGPQNAEAVKAFEEVIAKNADTATDQARNRQLAMLALGRVSYGMGKYNNAVEAYEKVPRFSRYWDQALFENGFARFQNDDYGGALGSLQALHAPQFSGAFQPESWILKATVYYFSCLYEEAKSALASFDRIYLPMMEQLRPLVEGELENKEYYRLIADQDQKRVPRSVLLWVRNNERMLGVFNMLTQIEAEKKTLTANPAWQGSKMVPDVSGFLDQNRETLSQVAGQLAKSRLAEAARNIKEFSDQAEIIRFETSKAEKEMFEAAVDQKAILDKQILHRPKMPAENWNYWKFQGEFWRDEIGYYQYTLKKGCHTRDAGSF